MPGINGGDMIFEAAPFSTPYWFGGPYINQKSLLLTYRHVTGTIIKKYNDLGQSGVWRTFL